MRPTSLLALLCGLGATLLSIGVANGCSLIAGYEDLNLAPSDAPDGNVGAGANADAGALPAIDLGAATIYSVYPSIFSPAGTLAGVTAQLPRIHQLGFNVLSLMPVTPIGAPTQAHPSNIGSPYCVHDYNAINAAYGNSGDLLALVQAAHALGIYVILDEELNETSWDNGLITTNPQYYVHTDGNPDNSNSIAGAFSLPDVAQLNYTTTEYGLQSYMASMLESWLTMYGIDGFRFVTADVSDVPQGPPTIPASFWQTLQTALRTVKPDVVMWADEEDPVLAGAPFALDYGWLLRGGQPGQAGGAGLQQVATGADAGELQTAWEGGITGYAGVLHTNFLENWDFDDDLEVYGGAPSTMAAATFDFTIDGVPMLWNGEEVGSDTAVADAKNAIDWQAPNAAAFTAFYTSLLALRNGYAALQQGTVTWIPNSAPGQVVSYTRSNANETLLVVISFAAQPVSGTLTLPTSSAWRDVSPTGSPGGQTHEPPPSLSLAPYDFAVFLAQ